MWPDQEVVTDGHAKVWVVLNSLQDTCGIIFALCSIIFGEIVMFVLSVTVYEIIRLNLFKWSRIESMTFKKYVNVMSYNIDEYITRCRFNGQHHSEKMAYLFKPVFVRSTNEAFKRTNTHAHNHIINPVSNNFIMWGGINVIYLISVGHLSIIQVKFNTSCYNVDINAVLNVCQDNID